MTNKTFELKNILFDLILFVSNDKNLLLPVERKFHRKGFTRKKIWQNQFLLIK
jgi:hypothetical protein